MKAIKRFFFLLVIVSLYCAWAASPVSAHALLLRSNPAANADLPKAPAQVELYFSEPVEPGLSSIEVYDSKGRQVDLGDVRVDSSDPTRMTVSLGSLSDGVYTVSWKAISSIDGHLTSGSFPFAIGNVSAAALAANPEENGSQLPASALISKWLLLAALALMVGETAYITLVWKPSLAQIEGKLPETLIRPTIWPQLYRIALVGLLAGLALNLLSQAGQATGSELALPWASETYRVMIETRLGLIWLVRLALSLACLWLALDHFEKAWKRWAGFVCGLALLLTISLTAHAATEVHPALPVFSDWVHLVGMCFWLGGLVYLLTGLREIRKLEGAQATRLTSLSTGHFSTLGLVSVGALGVTGLYAAYLRVGSLSALYTTIYGQALLLKQIFVGLLLVLAAINLLVITPRLKQARLQGASNTELVAHFGKTVLAEVILAGLLLASVSLLTYLPPAKVTPPSFDLTGSATVNDLHIDLKISPGFVGQNTFSLQLTSNGQPVQSVKQALLRFTPAQGSVPPSEIQLLGQGNGTYSVKGSNLSLPSNWQVQVVVRRENKFDAYANFNFQVGAPGSSSESPYTPRVAGALLLLNGLLLGLIWFPKQRRFTLRLGGASLLVLVLLAEGIFVVTRPISNINSQANPIPPDAQSIAAGKAIYETHCVECHGKDGKGDGPLGKTLIPRPADFTVHAVPGVHTDAQLFEWITNGFPGSAMPAWKSKLSDTDRWDLVNFLRTFAPQQSP